jgi:hypothetical protein
VVVILYEALLVSVRVRVGLSVVAVFVLVIDVLMIVQDVRVAMRRIAVSVFMSVLSGHSCSITGRINSGEFPFICGFVGPR